MQRLEAQHWQLSDSSQPKGETSAEEGVQLPTGEQAAEDTGAESV
jgi:hypothetical protein